MDAFARVLAEPGSTTARQALLAAWKAKRDPRAVLLEKQLAYDAYERGAPMDYQQAAALDREINLLEADHGRAWAGEVAGLVTKLRYRRGLVAEVTLSGVDFVARAARLCSLAPIQHVTITGPLPPLDRLFGVAELAKLVSLNLPGLGAAFGDAGANALARSPQVRGVAWISLAGDAIGEAGAEALAASPFLASVQFLELRDNPADPTPYASEDEGSYTAGRPALAGRLEKMFGVRPWLSVPSDPAHWPPTRESLAVTR